MNLRVIKKDIKFLIDEFLSDAIISMSFNGDESKAPAIVDLANEALDLQEETLVKVNHPDGNKKVYYRNLMDELLGALDVLYDRLSETVRKNS